MVLAVFVEALRHHRIRPATAPLLSGFVGESLFAELMPNLGFESELAYLALPFPD
jgi:hypothetical protein